MSKTTLSDGRWPVGLEGRKRSSKRGFGCEKAEFVEILGARWSLAPVRYPGFSRTRLRATSKETVGPLGFSWKSPCEARSSRKRFTLVKLGEKRVRRPEAALGSETGTRGEKGSTR
jgi:hypothetical protein